VAVAAEHDLVGARQPLVAQHLFFDLRGEHVHATDDQHVVRAAHDATHAPETARGRRQQASQITRAVSDDGHGLFGQGGEHQFAFFAIGHGLASVGVDDFGVKVVFPNDWAILAFNALAGHAGAHHL
jgi:hypothetical protein